MKAKLPIILVVIILLFRTSYSQTHFHYYYDISGNRILREIVLSPRVAFQEFMDSIENYSLNVFPNPTKGEINVLINGSIDTQQSKIEVFDLQSKIVFSKSPLDINNTINLATQPNGKYFLKIYINKEMREWKIVKME